MQNMSRENVYDDFTSSDTKGERHEGLLRWPPWPLVDFSAALMASAPTSPPAALGAV